MLERRSHPERPSRACCTHIAELRPFRVHLSSCPPTHDLFPAPGHPRCRHGRPGGAGRAGGEWPRRSGGGDRSGASAGGVAAAAAAGGERSGGERSGGGGGDSGAAAAEPHVSGQFPDAGAGSDQHRRQHVVGWIWLQPRRPGAPAEWHHEHGHVDPGAEQPAVAGPAGGAHGSGCGEDCRGAVDRHAEPGSAGRRRRRRGDAGDAAVARPGGGSDAAGEAEPDLSGLLPAATAGAADAGPGVSRCAGASAAAAGE